MDKFEDINMETDSNEQSDTQLSLGSFFYTWTLDNFSKCLTFSDAKIYSPVFNFDNTNWRLILHVISEDNQLKKLVIRLFKVGNDGTGFYLKYKFSLCDDNGSLSTKEAESRLDWENIWGHRLSFENQGDGRKVLDTILKNDKLIIHSEFLVLSSTPSGNPTITSKHTNDSKKEDKKSKSLKTQMISSPQKSLPRIVRRLDDRKHDLQSTVLFIFTACVMMFVIVSPLTVRNLKKNNDVRPINELIIDSTIKVMIIAEKFNMTEIKNKSLELLRSYRKNYNDSGIEFPKRNYLVNLDL